MYVIIAYDVSVERVNKVKSYLRTCLTWVQNSLFEGDVSESRLIEIKYNVARLIDKDADTVVFYILPGKKVMERITIGISKGNPNEHVI